MPRKQNNISQVPVIPEILSPVNDWIFKLIFGDERNKNILISFLQSFVDLPQEEYELIFVDPHLKPEYEDDKLGILDVKVKTKTGKIINIEMMVRPTQDFGEKISFYKSKMIVEQIGKSKDYSVIQRVICICIANRILHPSTPEYLNYFVFMNPRNGLIFEDIPEEIFTLEIPKVPMHNDRDDREKVWNWMRFFRAKSREEFEMLANETKNPEIRSAIEVVFDLSLDEATREQYWRQELARMDHQVSLKEAHEEGIEKGIEKGIKKGRAKERKKWEGVVAEKDAALAEKDALIAELQARLGEKG